MGVWGGERWVCMCECVCRDGSVYGGSNRGCEEGEKKEHVDGETGQDGGRNGGCGRRDMHVRMCVQAGLCVFVCGD